MASCLAGRALFKHGIFHGCLADKLIRKCISRRNHRGTGRPGSPHLLYQGREGLRPLPGPVWETMSPFRGGSWGDSSAWRQVARFTQPEALTGIPLSTAVRVQVWPKPTVQEGQQVNLTCLVWATHPAQLTYTWYQDGQQRPGARSISLPNVTLTDAASYRCGVGSAGQVPRLSAPVTLDILCESDGMQGGVQGMTRAPQLARTTHPASRWSTGQGALVWGK